MEAGSLGTWLLDQAPVIVVMGVIIWALWKERSQMRKEHEANTEKMETEIKRLNEESKSISKRYDETHKLMIQTLTIFNERHNSGNHGSNSKIHS